MQTLQMLVIAAFPAFLFLALPFVASTLAALAAAGVQWRLKRTLAGEQPAGEWLATEVDAAALPVRVHVSAEIAGSADGYWPRPAIIGLSPRTWVDRSLAGRAVASHELGHARLWVDDPAYAGLLARARQVYGGGTVLAGAGFLVAALLDSPSAAVFGVVALVAALIGGVGVILDEANASVEGARLLAARGLRTRGTDAVMALALAAYAAPVLVQVGFLCQTEAFVGALLVPTRLSPDNSDLGLWAILLLGPVLLLRAAQVLVDLPGEVPVTSELRLSWNLFQERSWELHSSVIVLLWLFLTFDEPVAQGLAPLFVLGAIPAMATLGALGRVLVVFPVFLVLALGGFYDAVDTRRTPRHPAPVGVADLVDPSPPLATRLVSLVRIAWLPLLVALSVRAIQGW